MSSPHPLGGPLLVISAHAGDFVRRAGGAIAQTTARGHRAEVVCLSYGESARAWREGHALDEIKTIRGDEAQAATAALGAEIEFSDVGDHPLPGTPPPAGRA